MSARRNVLLASFVAALLASALFGATSADAAVTFKYMVQMYGANNNDMTSPVGSVYVLGLDSTKDVNVQIRRGADPSYSSHTQAAGASSYYGPQVTDLIPGDTIEVRQPSGAALPTESYVIPPIAINLTLGSNAVSATVPAGQAINTDADTACVNNVEDDYLPTTAGSFADTLAQPSLPGDSYRVVAYSSQGDSTSLQTYLAGETPCIGVSSFPSGSQIPGSQPDPAPYNVYVNNLSGSVAPSLKLVHRRGATVLSSTSLVAGYFSEDFADPALPGDVYELYRPQAAATPSQVYTVPTVSSVFDPSVDMVALDTPAGHLVGAYPCRQYTCPQENGRELLNPMAGRSILDFSKASVFGGKIDMLPTDRVYAEFVSTNGTLRYSVKSAVGDLVAPVQSIKLPSKLKRKTLTKAFKKGFKVRLKSNEPGSAKLTLVFPKAKAGKAVTLAKASKPVKLGTTTVALKFTKSGKNALGKLRKRSSRGATLTSTVTDASGNVSTIVKRTKIKA